MSRQQKAQLGRCRIAFECRHSPRTFAIVRAKCWPRTVDSPVAFGQVPARIDLRIVQSRWKDRFGAPEKRTERRLVNPPPGLI